MTERRDVFPPPLGPSGTPASLPAMRPPATSFRRTLFRVMAVQVITLVLLWLLQARYTP